jgi:predicted transcriptional regulator
LRELSPSSVADTWFESCLGARMDDSDDSEDADVLSLAQLMSMPAIAIGPDVSTAEVLMLAAEHAIHHFPIVQEGRLLGIVCISDLHEDAPHTKVIDKAWRHVVTATPPSSADDAARLMRLHGVDSVVVADEEGIWGIVTREDLLEADPELERLLRGA